MTSKRRTTDAATLDLIRESIQLARSAKSPGAAMVEPVISLLQLNEFELVLPLLREALNFPAVELGKFLRALVGLGEYQLAAINHEAALRACVELYLTPPRVLERALFDSGYYECEVQVYDPGWAVAASYRPLAESALRLSLLSWWLECTERYISSCTENGYLDRLNSGLEAITNQMTFCRDSDFWRKFADLMPTQDLKSKLLARLAVHQHQWRSAEEDMRGREAKERSRRQTAEDARRGHERSSSSPNYPRQDTRNANDPWVILGIAQGARLDEISAAYRKLAKKYHPDVDAGLATEFQQLAEQKMREINAAYEKLKTFRSNS